MENYTPHRRTGQWFITKFDAKRQGRFPMPERVITYIDGFNLYHGMKDAGFRRYYWLDVRALSASLLSPGQTLVGVKYFSARITGPQDKKQRQTDYLDALATIEGLRCFFGHYRDDPVSCNGCGRTWMDHEEKMTDVRIATEMLMDAHADRFDTAALISGDSDLVPPVNAIHGAFPQKQVVVRFPPERHSKNLVTAAKGSFTIGRAKLRDAQLPDEVQLPSGFIITRPALWA